MRAHEDHEGKEEEGCDDATNNEPDGVEGRRWTTLIQVVGADSDHGDGGYEEADEGEAHEDGENPHHAVKTWVLHFLLLLTRGLFFRG